MTVSSITDTRSPDNPRPVPIDYTGYSFHRMRLDPARQLSEALLLYAQKHGQPATHALMHPAQFIQLGDVDGVIVEPGRNVAADTVFVGEAVTR